MVEPTQFKISKWESSPGRSENKKYLKPPPSDGQATTAKQSQTESVVFVDERSLELAVYSHEGSMGLVYLHALLVYVYHKCRYINIPVPRILWDCTCTKPTKVSRKKHLKKKVAFTCKFTWLILIQTVHPKRPLRHLQLLVHADPGSKSLQGGHLWSCGIYMEVKYIYLLEDLEVRWNNQLFPEMPVKESAVRLPRPPSSSHSDIVSSIKFLLFRISPKNCHLLASPQRHPPLTTPPLPAGHQPNSRDSYTHYTRSPIKDLLP